MTTPQLDRRREQSAAAADAAEKARTAVTALRDRLHTNADLTGRQTQALSNAEAEAKRLKRSLKTQARDKTRLEKELNKAVGKAKKAEGKAKTAEQKYDKSLLADMIRREKERDRAPAPKAAPTTTRARRPAADPAPEKPSATVTSATRTAARKTAARSS